MMRKEAQDKRRIEIENIAYELIERNGFLGISMLAIAKRAKASNETLYRWYGDKVGLFRAMVERNASHVKDTLLASLDDQAGSELDIIKEIGPILLRLLVSERAIALNRAAAADSTGVLGEALSQAGREDILPIIGNVFERIQQSGQFKDFELPDLCSLYMNLLIGDLQIRRAIGAVGVLDEAEIKKRSEEAYSRLMMFA